MAIDIVSTLLVMGVLLLFTTQTIIALLAVITFFVFAALVDIVFNIALVRNDTAPEQAQAAAKDIPTINVSISSTLDTLKVQHLMKTIEEMRVEFSLATPAEYMVRQDDMLVDVVSTKEKPVQNMPERAIRTFLVHSQRDFLVMRHLYGEDVKAENPPLGFVLFGVDVSNDLLNLCRDVLDKSATTQLWLRDVEPAG
ncbi:hypothetical protein F4803DRAFT_573020 [Xylaria telfairii]|nr:hypothetical protein F4803DRAFT_573020 [Xylaria telfairii]